MLHHYAINQSSDEYCYEDYTNLNTILVFVLWANLDLTTKCCCNCLMCRTQALDESSSLEMLPDRLRTEIAIHVHLDTLRKVWAKYL